MYSAQLLPDETGCTALRKVMRAALDYADDALLGSLAEMRSPDLSMEEVDALHKLYAKLTDDMKRFH